VVLILSPGYACRAGPRVERRGSRTRPTFADIATAEGACQADHQAAQHGAGDVADAPQNRGRERIQPVLKTHLIADGVNVQAIHNRRGSGQRAAQCKGQRNHTVDVDAHQLSRHGILSRGTHGLAEPRGFDEHGERGHDGNRDRHDHQVLGRKADRGIVAQQILP